MEPLNPFILIAYPSDMEALCNRVRIRFEQLRQQSADDLGLEAFSWHLEMAVDQIDSSKPAQLHVPLASHPLCQGVIVLLGEHLGTPVRLPHIEEFQSRLSTARHSYRPDANWRNGLEQEGAFPITGTAYECLTTWDYNRQLDFDDQHSKPLLVLVIGDEDILTIDEPANARWGMHVLRNTRQAALKAEKNEMAFFNWMTSEYMPGIRKLSNFLHYLVRQENMPLRQADSYDAALEQVSTFLQQHFDLGARSRKRKPFKGLRYYDLQDDAIFFGREKQTREVLNQFYERWDKEAELPFVSILGGSGVGKSSFMRAGLVAGLQKRSYFGFYKMLIILSDSIFSLQTTDPPLLKLWEALATQCGMPGPDTAEAKHFGTRSPADQAHSLLRLVKQWLAGEPREDKLIIAIDQFEYLIDYRQSAALSQRLEGLFLFMSDAVRSGVAGIFLTCQTNRMQQLNDDPTLGDVFDRGLTKTLRFSRDQCEEIVNRAFEVADVRVSNQEIQEISHELIAFIENNRHNRDSLLPIIANTLDLYYEQKQLQQSEKARSTSSISTGPDQGVPQKINVGDSLNQLAELALSDAKSKPGFWEEDAPKLLLRRLVRLQPGNHEQLVLLQASVDRSIATRNLVDSLLKYRLLVNSGAQVQFVHEAIINHWELARQWKVQESAFLEYEGLARVFASSWEKHGHDANLLQPAGHNLDNFCYLLSAWYSVFRTDAKAPDPEYLRVKEYTLACIQQSNSPWRRVPGDEEVAELSYFLLSVAYGDLAAARQFLQTDTALKTDSSGRGSNAIYQAALSHSMEMLSYLLDAGVDPDQPNNKAWRPSHLAANTNQVEAYQLLVSHGADHLAPGAGRTNALHLACTNGHEDMVDYLLSLSPPFDLNSTSKGNWTALTLACQNNANPIISRLLSLQTIDINIATKDHWSALHIACRNNNAAAVAQLLAREDVDIHLKTEGNWSALHLACRYASAQIVSALLQTDIDVNEPTNAKSNRYTPLSLAVFGGQSDVVSLLLRSERIKHQFEQYNESPLSLAVAEDNLPVFELLCTDPGVQAQIKAKDLLRPEVKRFMRTDQLKWMKLVMHCFPSLATTTALILAVEAKSLEAIEFLIGEYHIDPTLEQADGTCALSEVAKSKSKSVEMLSMMLSLRPGLLQFKDYRQRNLLHLAVAGQNLAACRYLLSRAAQLAGEQDSMLRTPLYYALQTRQQSEPLLELVQLLLEATPKELVLQHKDREGFNALHLAIIQGNQLFTRQLIDYSKQWDLYTQAVHPALNPVQIALLYSFTEIIDLLVSYDTDCLSKAFEQEHALLYVLRHSDLPTLLHLVQAHLSQLPKPTLAEQQAILPLLGPVAQQLYPASDEMMLINRLTQWLGQATV